MQKIAVITGASQGIGRSVAIYLAKLQYTVLLLARNENKLQSTCNEILNNGGNCEYHISDVSNSKDVESSINKIIVKHQKIDLLIHCAGILKHGTSEIMDDDLDQLLQTNLNGAIYVTKQVAKHMKKQKHGYIIILSSIGGKVAQSFSGAYAASKFGLTGFSEALAKEMSLYGVKVTSICPSMTATDMVADGRAFKSDKMLQLEDINETIGYLLKLGPNAVPLEIAIHCLPFVESMARATYKVYGLENH